LKAFNSFVISAISGARSVVSMRIPSNEIGGLDVAGSGGRRLRGVMHAAQAATECQLAAARAA
jgi:hypothetical protein